jgi:hypothetical protein
MSEQQARRTDRPKPSVRTVANRLNGCQPDGLAALVAPLGLENYP